MESCNKTDLNILNLLPNELWAIVLSYLPRVSRYSLSKIHGFKELIENVTYLEEKKLYNAIRSGNKLYWRKVSLSVTCSMQSRLKHGAINFNNELFIFGGAATNLMSSGNYNDTWVFNNYDCFRRMVTSSSTFPSPKSNFGMTNSGRKIFILGGRSSVGGAIEHPYSSSMTASEIHSLDAKRGVFQKILSTGDGEPRVGNGIRCVMLSSTELIAVSAVVPTFHEWDAMVAEENVHYRTSLQVSLLKFSDDTLERGHWYNLADIQQHRRGLPIPRTESHLVNLGNDCILLFGGRAINQSSCQQDAWIMKISRNPYALKWHQVTVDNPLVPSLPTHIFPSCIVQDLLVFTGVRTSAMKKPENDKLRNNNNNNNNNEPQRSPSQHQQQHQQSPSSSSSSSSSTNSHTIRQQQQQQSEMRRIFINSERPLNTIGAMSAFSVYTPLLPVIPQKVLKIQISPEPSPTPPQLPKAIRTRDYPMRVFCLDLSNVMNCTEEMLREKLSVRWLTLKNNGLYNGAPELRAHATFNRLDNGIVLIGGVKRNQAAAEEDSVFTQATNEVFMLTYNNDDET